MKRHLGPPRADRVREAGFTLLEMLIALALFSLLSMTLFGSLRLAIGAWTRGNAHGEEVGQTLHVQNLLRRLVEDAYPLFLTDDPPDGHVDFDGTLQAVTFLASTPIVLGTGGRSRISLSAQPRGNQVDLVLTSNLELARPDDRSVLMRKPLLPDLAAVEFSYFGRLASDRNPVWHPQWKGQSALPQLIRVLVRFPSDDPRIWPELVITPRITADVGCVHDLLTNRCRGR